MSVYNAFRKGLQVDKAVIIGSGDLVEDITDDHTRKLGLKGEMNNSSRKHFEKKYGGLTEDYDAYKAAAKTLIPTLVIHDEYDPEVPVKAGLHIYEHLKHGELMLTKRLGHRKILADFQVIEKI